MLLNKEQQAKQSGDVLPAAVTGYFKHKNMIS